MLETLLDPDVMMVIITTIYVIATIIICVINSKALKESRAQFNRSIELQKQHNYDSVRPAVTIDFNSNHTPDTLAGSITIKNHGLGPAVIKGLYFTRDGKDYKNENGYCTPYDMVQFRLTEESSDLKPEDICNSFHTKEFRNCLNDMDYLAINEELLLLSFETSDKNETEFVRKIFDNVSMELVYTDIYDSHEWRVIKSLNYFKPVGDWI